MSFPPDECWEPLEGSADVLSAFSKELGVETAAFQDVLAFDLVPAQAAALIFLYPTIEELEVYLKQRQSDSATTLLAETSQVFFLKQLLGGTCGTIASVHALANGLATTTASNNLPNSSPLDDFVQSEIHGGLTADAVMRWSKHLLRSAAIRSAHSAAVDATNLARKTHAATGQRQGRHFITFVHRNGLILQLNCRESGPVCCGATSDETFVHDAVREVTQMLSATDDPSIHFSCNLIALVPLAHVS